MPTLCTLFLWLGARRIKKSLYASEKTCSDCEWSVILAKAIVGGGGGGAEYTREREFPGDATRGKCQ